MHSSSTGPSDSERSSGLPCMRWPLQGLRRLWVVLLSVPPPGWRAAGVVSGAASAGPAAAEGQDGRESVREDVRIVVELRRRSPLDDQTVMSSAASFRSRVSGAV